MLGLFFSMEKFFCVLLVLLSPLVIAQSSNTTRTTTTKNPSPSSSTTLSGLNLPTLPNPHICCINNAPPKEFTIRTAWTMQPLVLHDTLMNTLHALVDHALKDFEGLVQAGSFASVGDYDKVRIDFQVPPAKTGGEEARAKRKYVIWGLSSAVSAMARSRKFVKSQWFLSWEGVQVGVIRFVPVNGIWGGGEGKVGSKEVARRALAARSGRPMKEEEGGGIVSNFGDESTNLGRVDNDFKDSSNPSNDPRLTVNVKFTKGSLTIFDVFLSSILLLSEVAAHNQNDVVQPRTFSNPHNNVIVRYGYDHVPARKTEPEFVYRYLIKGLGRIPQYMLEYPKFGNAEVVFEVDNIAVGDGYIGMAEAVARKGTVAVIEST